MKYKIIVDYGKPYEQDFKTKKDLIKELKRLKEFYNNQEEDFPYFNISIYKNNKEITEEINAEGKGVY
jgi:hypothetical protein